MVHSLRFGSRIQSRGELVRTWPTMPCALICSMDSMALMRGPWKV